MSASARRFARLLRRHRREAGLSGSIADCIVSYAVGGKQYVAVRSGSFARYFGGSGSPTVTVFELNASSPTVVDARHWPATAAQSGVAIFPANCAVCHGAGAPEVRLRRGKTSVNARISLPKLYPDPLSRSEVEVVAKYVESL